MFGVLGRAAESSHGSSVVDDFGLRVRREAAACLLSAEVPLLLLPESSSWLPLGLDRGERSPADPIAILPGRPAQATPSALVAGAG